MRLWKRLTEWLDRRWWWNPIYYPLAEVEELERKWEALELKIKVATYE